MAAEIAAALEGRAWECLWIDDGSTDAGPDRLAGIAAAGSGKMTRGFRPTLPQTGYSQAMRYFLGLLVLSQLAFEVYFSWITVHADDDALCKTWPCASA